MATLPMLFWHMHILNVKASKSKSSCGQAELINSVFIPPFLPPRSSGDVCMVPIIFSCISQFIIQRCNHYIILSPRGVDLHIFPSKEIT